MNNLRRKVVLFSALFVLAAVAIGAGTVFEKNVRIVLQKTDLTIGAATITGATALSSTLGVAGDVTLDDGVTNSPSLVLKDGSDVTGTFTKLSEADTTFTPGTTTESLRIVTGNLRVGNGTADVTLAGEDAYVEGTLEVDGAVRIDGAIDANSTANFAEPVTLQEGVASTTGTFSGDVTLSSSLIRTSQEYCYNAGGKPGSANGWLTTGGLVNLFNYTLPASEATTATLVFPVSGLHVGDVITAWKLVGQGESAGNVAELDGDLRSITTVSTGNTDASVGAITPIHIVADTAIAAAKTGLTETVAANKTYYVLLSGTTAANTDFDIQGITVTVTTN